jgi:RNA recognition motif-containing protein
MNLFIGNLSPETSEDALRQIFSEFGTVLTVKIPIDNATGLPRGFGFVEMEDKFHAYDAIDNLDTTYLLGNIISVKESKPKTQGGTGGGFNRNNNRQGGGGGFNRNNNNRQGGSSGGGYNRNSSGGSSYNSNRSSGGYSSDRGGDRNYGNDNRGGERNYNSNNQGGYNKPANDDDDKFNRL